MEMRGTRWIGNEPEAGMIPKIVWDLWKVVWHGRRMTCLVFCNLNRKIREFAVRDYFFG